MKSILSVLAIAALFTTSAVASTTTSGYASSATCMRRTSRRAASVPLAQPRVYKGDENISILQLLRKDRRFSKLVTALTRAGGELRDDLDDVNARNKITLLSPTDEAFEVLEKMHGQTVDTMSNDMLQKLLAYHVIPSEEEGRDDGMRVRRNRNVGAASTWASPSNTHDGIRKEDLCDGETLETALIDARLGDNHESGNRQRVRVTKYAGKVIFNMYAQVIDSDLVAGNGVVHALADVLMLPEQLFTGVATLPNMFSTHALALKLTGLDKRVDSERGVTAFVPTNSAWESLGFFQTMELFHPSNRDELKDILMRHYISEPIFVNELIREEALRGTRAGATCTAARLNDAAYFDALRRASNINAGRRIGATRYYAEHMSTRVGLQGGPKDEFEREFETWSGHKVQLRVECHEGGVDVLINNSVVTLADVPAGNGALHVLTQPIDTHTQNRRNDDDDDDEGVAQLCANQVRGRRNSINIDNDITQLNCNVNANTNVRRNIRRTVTTTVRAARNTLVGLQRREQQPFVFPGRIL